MSPGLDGALPKNGYSFSGSFSRLSGGACGIALTSSAYGGQWSNGASSRCAYNGFLPGSSDMSLVQKRCGKGLEDWSIEVQKSGLVEELSHCCGRIDLSPKTLASWPTSVAKRWKNLNKSKCTGNSVLEH